MKLLLLVRLISALSSLPLWERGLKYETENVCDYRYRSLPLWERGLKSNMIEVDPTTIWSLPSWERGLKYCSMYIISSQVRRSPRGSVD